MMQAMTRALTWTPVTVASIIVLSMILGPAIADGIKHAVVTTVVSMAPVKHSFHIGTQEIEGGDVIVSGSMIKRWACAYQPPPRAVDASGLHYEVISYAATKASNWPAGTRFAFGPWRVVNAANRRVMFYQEDECWGVSVFTPLGQIDTRIRQ